MPIHVQRTDAAGGDLTGTYPNPTVVATTFDARYSKLTNNLFDHYADVGNVTTGETDLYTDSIAGSTLVNNGDKIIATHAGIFVFSGTATRELKVYFGGTLILDTGALSVSAAADWTINTVVIRDSSSSVRCSVWVNLTGASLAAFDNYATVTGLTLTNAQILKVTGQAAGVGAATNDIVAKIGTVYYRASA